MKQQPRPSALQRSGATTPERAHSGDVPGVLPLSAVGRDAFQSPLLAPPSPPRAARLASPALLIVGVSSVLAVGLIALALVVRSERSNVGVQPERAAAQPAHLARASLGSAPAVSPGPVHGAQPSAALASATPPTVPDVGAVRQATAAIDMTPPKVEAPAVAAAGASEHPARRASKRERAKTRATRARAAAKPQPALPAHPTRQQVIAAMQRVTPAVRVCFGGRRGVARVNFTVLGKTGRVTTARVTGQSGTVGSCIARAVRAARLPKFQQSTLEIAYPFSN